MMTLDANRSRVLQKVDMASLFKRLESTEKQAGLAIGVLYNLCLDYGIHLQLVSSFYSHIW